MHAYIILHYVTLIHTWHGMEWHGMAWHEIAWHTYLHCIHAYIHTYIHTCTRACLRGCMLACTHVHLLFNKTRCLPSIHRVRCASMSTREHTATKCDWRRIQLTSSTYHVIACKQCTLDVRACVCMIQTTCANVYACMQCVTCSPM